MAMDHVRRMGEDNALSLEPLLFGVDVADAEIEDRFRRAAVALREKQPHAAAVEKCERAVSVEMAQAKRLAVKPPAATMSCTLRAI